MSWEEKSVPRGAVWSVRVVTGVVAGLLLVGCGSEQTPEAESDATGAEEAAEAAEEGSGQETEAESSQESEAESSQEPVPASSEGPAENWPEPEKPDAMSEDTEEGALAALEYWWELRQYARNTGDVESWQDTSGDECEFCNHDIELTEKAFDQGVWYVQEPDAISEASSEMPGHGSVTIYFQLDPGPFQSFDDEGLHTDSEGGSQEQWSADLVFDDEWAVAEVGVTADAEEPG